MSNAQGGSIVPGEPARRRFFNLQRRGSTSSVNTISSINTLLPVYSETSSTHGEEGSSYSERSSESPTTSESSVNTFYPPRYSTVLLGNVDTSRIDGGTVIPHVEHKFPIRNAKPWATLLLFTPTSTPGFCQETIAKPKSPRFIGGRPISGMVELDLESTQTIRQISITVRGKIVYGYLVDEAQTFLEYKHVIWDKSMGEPPSSTPSNGKKPQGKLLGSYQLPFSFAFPSQVELGSHLPYDEKLIDLRPPKARPFSVSDPNKVHKRQSSMPQTMKAALANDGLVTPTPQSFMEASVTASVQYELSVHISHGFLRPDSRIKTAFLYVPSITPESMSLKRRTAYENNALAPGPSTDLDGWFALPTSVIQGQLGGVGGGRKVHINATLYLAKPLSYTRGTFIPCYLDLSCEDSGALDALSNPSTPYVRLIRHVRHFYPQGEGAPEASSEGSVLQELNHGGDPGQINMALQGTVPFGVGIAKGDTFKTAIDEVGVGVWWVPPKDVLQEPNMRYLEGEIHLSRDLQPSCACSLFQVEYFVEMLPLASSIFEPTPLRDAPNTRKQVLSSYQVEIATCLVPDAPQPVAFTDPPKSSGRNLPDRGDTYMGSGSWSSSLSLGPLVH